jgi:hypothetical protein
LLGFTKNLFGLGVVDAGNNLDKLKSISCITEGIKLASFYIAS